MTQAITYRQLQWNRRKFRHWRWSSCQEISLLTPKSEHKVKKSFYLCKQQRNKKKLCVLKFFPFFAGVVDNGDQPLLSNITRIIVKIRKDPSGILRGPGETDSWKIPEVGTLVSNSFSSFLLTIPLAITFTLFLDTRGTGSSSIDRKKITGRTVNNKII